MLERILMALLILAAMALTAAFGIEGGAAAVAVLVVAGLILHKWGSK